MAKPEPRILLVDDEAHMRRTVCRMLHGMGYQNVEENDSSTVLAVLKQKPPDLLICDWIMEPQTGLQVLEFVRRDPALKALPFIMLTGETDAEAVVTAVGKSRSAPARWHPRSTACSAAARSACSDQVEAPLHTSFRVRLEHGRVCLIHRGRHAHAGIQETGPQRRVTYSGPPLSAGMAGEESVGTEKQNGAAERRRRGGNALPPQLLRVRAARSDRIMKLS